MIENKTEPTPISIIPTPVVVFTHADAQQVAEMCPVKLRTDWHNIIAVGAMTDFKLLGKAMGQMVVTHHIKSKTGSKEKVAGSWTVTVALAPLGTGEPHCFKVIWPQEGDKAGGPGPNGAKAADIPEVFREVLGETGPKVVAHA